MKTENQNQKKVKFAQRVAMSELILRINSGINLPRIFIYQHSKSERMNETHKTTRGLLPPQPYHPHPVLTPGPENFARKQRKTFVFPCGPFEGPPKLCREWEQIAGKNAEN